MKITIAEVSSSASSPIKTIKAVTTGRAVPEAGREYYLEDARHGTTAQGRLFHKLLRIYFNAGHSYPAKTFEQFRAHVLREHGGKIDLYVYIDDDGNLAVEKDLKKIPASVLQHPRHVMGKMASWADYSVAERRESISTLITEMINTGINDKDFESILEEFHAQ